MSGETSPLPAAARFSTNKIARLVETYRLDAPAFDPDTYGHTYGLYTILTQGAFGEEGGLTIRAAGSGEGARRLDIALERRTLSDHGQYIDATLHCAGDALSTPRRWSMRSRLATGRDAPAYLGSDLAVEGRRDGDRLRLAWGGHAKTVDAGPEVASKWGLFDAVQRMSHRTRRGPWRFTLLDEADQVHTGAELAWHQAGIVAMGAGPRTLHAWRLTGKGIIPTVYWVDASGRLLFVLSGSEVYVLKEADGAAASFDTALQLAYPQWEDSTTDGS